MFLWRNMQNDFDLSRRNFLWIKSSLPRTDEVWISSFIDEYEHIKSLCVCVCVCGCIYAHVQLIRIQGTNRRWLYISIFREVLNVLCFRHLNFHCIPLLSSFSLSLFLWISYKLRVCNSFDMDTKRVTVFFSMKYEYVFCINISSWTIHITNMHGSMTRPFALKIWEKCDFETLNAVSKDLRHKRCWN